MEGAEYMFRIFAENIVGRSEPIVSDTVILRSLFREYATHTAHLTSFYLKLART